MTYQDILKNEFQTRSQRNPAYSLRAFAKTLGMSAPHLSDILRGKKGLSVISAKRVSQNLKLNSQEQQNFCDLVTVKHSKNHSEIKMAKARLREVRKNNSFQAINSTGFKVVADWYHLAILHLLELDDFQPDSKWISSKLSLPLETVNEAIERLEKAQLIDRSENPWKLKNKFTTTVNVSSLALKSFHHQILQKAAESIETQTSIERDLSAMVLACDKDKISEAKEWLKNFRRKFCKDLDQGSNKNQIYCLSMQFFKLSDMGEK